MIRGIAIAVALSALGCKANRGDEGPATVAEPAAALPGECHDYHVAIERLAACGAMAPAARDAMRGALATAEQKWQTARLEPKSAAAQRAGCRSGADAATAMLARLCPELTPR